MLFSTGFLSTTVALEHLSHRGKPKHKNFGSFPSKKAALYYLLRVRIYAKNALEERQISVSSIQHLQTVVVVETCKQSFTAAICIDVEFAGRVLFYSNN